MDTIFSAFEKGPFQYIVVDQYKKREIETIKVSILEDDELMQDLLKNVMERTAGEYFRADVMLVQDRDSILNSNWNHSSDTHVVMVNDVLKKRNGLEILHTLRRMPNHKKYIIIMLTKRRSEEDMLYVFEQGADEYIRKPFDIRLIEAKIKSLLRRLRL
ncbi:response regulator [Alcanivoracaceae bacterium MT1]